MPGWSLLVSVVVNAEFLESESYRFRGEQVQMRCRPLPLTSHCGNLAARSNVL